MRARLSHRGGLRLRNAGNVDGGRSLRFLFRFYYRLSGYYDVVPEVREVFFGGQIMKTIVLAALALAFAACSAPMQMGPNRYRIIGNSEGLISAPMIAEKANALCAEQGKVANVFNSGFRTTDFECLAPGQIGSHLEYPTQPIRVE
jgi:hypothetical protein